MKNDSLKRSSSGGSGTASLNGLDNYEIDFPIGRGSHSHVYRAIHRPSGQTVALKVMEAKTTEDVARIRKEVSIHKQFNHPHIVKLIDYFIEDSSHYLVLELCPKGEFYAHFSQKKGKFTEKEIKRYLFQALSALEHVHDRGVVHRDIKMGNILVSEAGDLKLTDFGLSVLFEEREEVSRGRLEGTPNYLPPELILKNKITFSNDTWAVGCLGFALLCGNLPFEGADIHSTRRNIVEKEAVLTKKCSKGMQEVMAVLLDKAYRNRRSARKILGMPWFSVDPSDTDSPEDDSYVLNGNRTGSTMATTGFHSSFQSSVGRGFGSTHLASFGAKLPSGVNLLMSKTGAIATQGIPSYLPTSLGGLGLSRGGPRSLGLTKERPSSLRRWPTDTQNSTTPHPDVPIDPFTATYTKMGHRPSGDRPKAQSIVKTRMNIQSVLEHLTQQFEIRPPPKK
jgi:serine/threonine protein kinase